MASQISSGVLRSGSQSQSQPPAKQRLKSFISRRSDSSDDGSPVESPLNTPADSASDAPTPIFLQYAANSSSSSPLGEIHNNQNLHRSPSRSPEKSYTAPITSGLPSRHNSKNKDRGRETDKEKEKDKDKESRRGPLASFTGKSVKDSASRFMSRDQSPVKGHKKTKSAGNIASFLTRPKTAKKEDEGNSSEPRLGKDKENRTPPTTMTANAEQSPIYQQFCADPAPTRSNSRTTRKENPKDSVERIKTNHTTKTISRSGSGHNRSKSVSAATHQAMSAATLARKANPEQTPIDPQDIDRYLEEMLDRRNIPENQRYKMRNLADTIKMEFIRQDWAEMAAAANKQDPSAEAQRQQEAAKTSAVSDEPAVPPAKTKRSRGRSFTLSRIGMTVKKGDKGLSLGRHLRSKSTDGLDDENEKPLGYSSSGEGGAAGASGGNGTGLLAKIMGTAPTDFVAYLRKTTKPETVEVGKLHKLRLLLRNETVSWIEDFIRQGGMKEMVGLLHRIMEIEWRDDHEDALLHENLLCLKALSTTALAQVYIHSIQDLLFPRLLHLLFDPDKKGPSEFTTRNIVTSILFMYIESGINQDRLARAANVLVHLRDPEPPESEKPLNFVANMHRPRPYRVWNKEVVNVTKEVFWIFLHHLNIVSMPDKVRPTDVPDAEADPDESELEAGLRYMARHFPAERPPVAAAPYVGGVEWDATNYLASHVDLLNAIIACTPTREARNHLRAELRISGWERCMGGSLRLCKEKFYPSVHEALRTWVAAAADDGWDVKDVRYGPPPESRSRSVSPSKSKVAPMAAVPLPGGSGGGDGIAAGAKMGVGLIKPPVEMAPRMDLPVPKLLTDSDSESISSRGGLGRNAAPAAEIRADDSWLR
ncbi:hypothetical protein TD95_003077 [Thielaviopsis punctulata]|uniref:Formin GTPase-binding domain-containing protein n=1 Tax=Thielaviopsis punctulata TaxID=72032 RepID=A0A0F4ZEZ6_9PEZI|nr:hypothetical protein TD95_003077 [Thielaviopsis punctulata]